MHKINILINLGGENMKNSAKKVVAKFAKKLFTRKAFSTHDSACYELLYQPKEPECLKKN